MPETLRLLQLGKHFDPDLGGIETVTAALAEALPAHGISADVLCMGLSGSAYPPVKRDYQVIRYPPTLQAGNKTVSLGYMRAIRRLQPAYDAALLHLPNPVGMLAAVAFWRKPLILLWHADVPPAYSALLTPLDRRAISMARRVIVPTPFHASGSVYADLIAAKMTVAPYPFDGRRLATATETTPNWHRLNAFIGKRQLVLAVGRLVAYKGFCDLVSAADALPSGIAVIIVGAGGLHGELTAQIEALGLGDRVLLAGSCSEAELSALFARASVFCLPSVTNAEMYGVVQVEALAFGVPIVSTAIPRSGVGWVNRDGVSGLVVPPGDPAALAAAISRVAGNPVLHGTLSSGARRLFDEEHDLDRAGARYAAIIRAAVDTETPV